MSKRFIITEQENLSKLFKNKVIYWDNFYANDYCPRRLFVGPYSGRKNIKNIMINPKNKIIKLIDLGEAMLVEENQLVYGLKGTEQYMAPEILRLYDFDPKRADLWCCGIVLYNLYYNRMPWNFAKLDNIHYKNHFNSIKNGILIEYIFPINTNYDGINETIIKKLLLMLLNVHPEKRKNSSMIKNYYSLLFKM